MDKPYFIKYGINIVYVGPLCEEDGETIHNCKQ